MNLLIKSCLVSKGNKFEKCDIFIENNIITKIDETIEVKADKIIDCKSKYVVSPSLFDMHVHFRDPGFEYKEDIVTGSYSAASGGFTGVACMPNTKPTIDNKDTIKYILDKAEDTGVKVYPVACITKGMTGNELSDYDELKSAGAVAISDDGKPVENAELMRLALEKSNENGLLVISHCEDLNIIKNGIINKGAVSEKLGVQGMDRASEDYITAREIALAASCNARIHIAHVSTKGSVQFIRAAKRNGYKVTCETCPHYFIFTEEKLLLKDADYRMNPPLRTKEDREYILEAVADGTIDCIVTDHAPHASEEKKDFLKAPNGVVGLETSFAAAITYLYHTKKCTFDKIIDLMANRPRKILGINTNKIAVGEEANICISDLDYEWTVIPEKLNSKSKNTVFKGKKLKGKVMYTISEGKIIYNYIKED